MELPKLSHLHALQLLLPLLPGVVVAVGLTLSSSSLSHRFWGIDLGYKTKLAVALSLTYVLGLAVMSVVDQGTAIIIGLIQRHHFAPGGAPWENSYWRRVATAYLGRNLSPATASFSLSDLDRINKYAAGVARTRTLEILQEFQQIDNRLQELGDKIERATQVGAEQAREALDGFRRQFTELSAKAQQSKQEITQNLIEQATSLEWSSLYAALRRLPAPANPYEAVSLLMSALQGAGIAAIWLIAKYAELRSLTGVFFFGLLTVSASYARWRISELNYFYGQLSSSQIAAMIQEMRKGKSAEAALAITSEAAEGGKSGVGDERQN